MTQPSARHAQTSCSDCGLQAVCLPPAVPPEALNTLESLIRRSRPLLRGQQLYAAGEPGGAIHAVRSGAFKTTRLLPDGSEQITGFHLPGEVIGLDALGHDSHETTATALEASSVCTIPVNGIEDLARQLPSLQTHLFHLLGREIRSDHQLLQLIAGQSADRRLATFLLSLSQRQQRQRLSGDHLRLPMSRSDLANHLGLALETVSRQLRRFQDEQLLVVSGKRIDICDMSRLHAAASAQCE